MITRLVNEKINKNNPENIYRIDNGGLPFETYILQIRDENQDYLLDRFIVNIKNQKLISKQLIGVEPDGEVPEDAIYTAKSFVLNKDLTINIFEVRFSKIYKKLKEAYKITSEGEIVKIDLGKSNFDGKAKPSAINTKADDWVGEYVFKVKNKDGLITSFSINIKSLSDIDVLYTGDGEPLESYKKLKAVNISRDKIKIIFNKKYQELGIIYIQKNDAKYIISGEPISSVNPGNDEYPLKKIK